MEIHKNISLARKKKGLTQEQLADLANVTVRTIQRIESGESIPRAFTIKTIAEALGTSFEDLTSTVSGDSLLTDNPQTHNSLDTANDKHVLNMLCLSCFSYLVIPFVHFLIPRMVLKKSGINDPNTIAIGRRIITQQIYWTVILCLLMILTAAYNFIIVRHFNKTYLLNYLWPLFGMYILNAFIIFNKLRRISSRDFKLVPTT